MVIMLIIMLIMVIMVLMVLMVAPEGTWSYGALVPPWYLVREVVL